MAKGEIVSAGRLFQIVEKVAWAAFLVALPVTSFPFFPAELGGTTQVRPLSIYPLLILIILVTLPRLIKNPLPLTFLPLFAFIVAAAISSILSFGLDIEAIRGVTVFARLARSLITLLIGMAFYLTVVLYQRNWQDLKFTLRWLYVGFIIVLAWGTLQSLYIIYYEEVYFDLLNKIQGFFSTQALYQARISGFTYEPKWFAEQITFLLMPWLVASVILRRSLFKWHYRWITVELLLLIWSAIVLLFTFSRTGLFVLVLLTFVSVLVSQSFHRSHKPVGPPRRGRRWLRLAQAGGAALALIVVLFAVGSRNPYFSRLWRYWSDEKAGNKSYLEYIAFGQRFAYAETAYRIFENYPVFGVGLGNYAFFFNEKLPDRPWQNLPEIIRQLTPTERGSQLITPKNLYARLLAETGLVGTILFTTFVIGVLGGCLYLLLSSGSESRYWGLASLLGIIVFATVVFSSDSFALPNMWIVFGLITAAAHMPTPLEESRSVAPTTPLADANLAINQ